MIRLSRQASRRIERASARQRLQRRRTVSTLASQTQDYRLHSMQKLLNEQNYTVALNRADFA
jgi:hypothetical protein